MQNTALTKLRSDFTAAISSDQNDVTLDPSIAKLERKSLILVFSDHSQFIREASCAK